MRSTLPAILLLALTTPCLAGSDGTLPDPAITPGRVATVIDEEGLPRPLTLQEICGRSTKDKGVRNVSNATKEAVRRSYGLTSKRDRWCNDERACEVDHLIPLAIGGDNDVRNLWPEAYAGDWSATDKDRLELEVRKRVCAGRLDLVEAQRGFLSNWKVFYVRVFGSIPDRGM